MTTIYDTELKQAKDGTFYRWVGEDEKGTKQNFRLGRDKAEAKRRLRLILALFETQAQAAEFYGGSWVAEFLSAAKKIAKGKKAVLPRLSLRVNETDAVQESSETYAKTLAYLNMDGELFQPEASEDFTDALRAVEADQRRNRLIRSKLTGSNPDNDPTGQTVGQAVDAFMESLKSDAMLPDGSLSTWGRTQFNQVKSWRRYMSVAKGVKNGEQVSLRLLETDLADLTVAKAQQMVDATRKRPLTFESKLTRRMTTKSAGSINKKIKHFFDWLDLSDDWSWFEPPRFRKVAYKVSPLTAEEKHQQKLKKEKWRITDDEIQILYRYATPAERVLILLGLNCAFGAGEIGNLRIPYVKFETQEIDGIRFKTGNDTRHHLWEETIEGLQWELSRREQLPKTDQSKDIVFLAEKGGNPLWSRTKTGNYNNGITKRWNDLKGRVKKDHPDFHDYSFGKLRKTAAIRVIEMADAEAASMILAHGIPSEDKVLSAYVNIPWQKLYEAQKAYGETIRPLLQTEGNAFEQPPKDYIGKNRALQILELFKSDVPVAQIARKTKVSVMTVYRHVDRAGLRDAEPFSDEERAT
ncbi:tyrosine-type recombinase/integrase [Gimesia sp.]|uniref:tyrosine-type recombinase/integrase n=1 Tax=Gimesia sp. TaxID=2024833 RepID=UPI003A92A9E7